MISLGGFRRDFLYLDLSDVTKIQIAAKQRYSLHLHSRFKLAIPRSGYGV